MSTTTTTTASSAKKKKGPPKKGSNAGYIVAAVATAAIVGTGVYFFAGAASAKSTKPKPKPKDPKAKRNNKGSASPPRNASGGGSRRTPSGRKAEGGTGGRAGGSAGPGGALPSGGANKGKGSGKGKRASGRDTDSRGDESEVEDTARKDEEPTGFFWGDRSKIPADFDFESNQIWVSPDRTAAAAGFYFFMDGYDATGERVTWDEEGLSFLISDGSVLQPTRDRDHREDPVPSLRKILRKKDPDTGELRLDSVFSWIAAYYGTGISPLEAATSRGVDVLQDMVDEASVLSGGRKRSLNLEGPLREFYGYALGRLEMGRRAIYGDGFAWGQGEEALG